MLFTLLMLSFVPSGDAENCNLTYDTWLAPFNVLDLVYCGDGASNGDCVTAEAGNPNTGLIDAVYQLNGSGTQVPQDPEAIAFAWSQIDNGLPMVTVQNADTATPTFTPTQVGDYEFQLDVTWYCRNDADTVVITISDEFPAPEALDADLVVNPGCADTPVYVAHPPNDDRAFIVCKEGTIKIFKNGGLLPTPFLDIDDVVNNSPNERGLLSMVFDPDYATNGVFYLNYTGNLPNVGGSPPGTTRVVAMATNAGDPDLADRSTFTEIISISQPQWNHNGGQLQFSPNDGHLYISVGDGGGGGDTSNNAQNLQTHLGKFLRLDTDGLNPATIPADNPFAGTRGNGLEEIWSYGLRNPWRFSFDRMTGDIYTGDVGQGAWEEINFVPASSPGGENYGWRLMEGNHCFNPSSGCDPGGLIYPVFEYPHGTGNICSVTGGYVYRGTTIPGLFGFYVLADYCGSGSGSGSALRYWTLIQRDEGWESAELDVFVNDSLLTQNVYSFGEDHLGELYIVAGSAIYKITGVRK